MFGGCLTAALRLEAQHNLGNFQLSINSVYAGLNPISSSKGSYSIRSVESQKLKDQHCPLALKVNVRAILQRPSGQTHIPLRCHLAQVQPGKQLPEPIPLTLVHLIGLGAVQTLCFEQAGQQFQYPSAHTIAQPSGYDGLLNDVWLGLCAGKQSYHTALRLVRSPGLSFALTHRDYHGPLMGLPASYIWRGQEPNQSICKKQT